MSRTHYRRDADALHDRIAMRVKASAAHVRAPVECVCGEQWDANTWTSCPRCESARTQTQHRGAK